MHFVADFYTGSITTRLDESRIQKKIVEVKTKGLNVFEIYNDSFMNI